MDDAREEILHLTVSGVRLNARLVRPAGACGLVLMAQEENGSAAARAGQAARLLRQAGFATMICDLRGSDLSVPGDADDEPSRLAVRLTAWMEVARQRAGLSELPLGVTAHGHAGAAALLVAMQRPDAPRALAVVSARTDLVLGSLPGVRCPTLLAVGEHDRSVLRHNRVAMKRLRCHRRLEVLQGLNHHAQEARAVARIAVSIRRWMRRYLIPPADTSGADLRPSLRVVPCDAPAHGTAIARSMLGLEAFVAATRACAALPLPPRADEE